jgi:hypothetical protein
MIYNKGKQQCLEQMPTRGFQSSVSSILHFGLGKESAIDSLLIVWQSGKQQKLVEVKGDQIVTLQEKNASSIYKSPKQVIPVFHEIESPIAYHHQKTAINDFKRQPLLVNPLSFSGPCLIKGDVNGDGLEDIYAGGGSGQAGSVYIQSKNGKFVIKNEPSFDADKLSEDADAIFLMQMVIVLMIYML